MSPYRRRDPLGCLEEYEENFRKLVSFYRAQGHPWHLIANALHGILAKTEREKW